MEIAERDRKEQAAEKAQNGIAEIPVQERHRVAGDPALKPVAHDEIAALAQARDEGLEVSEIVTPVGVAHDDVRAMGGANAFQQCRAIAARLDAHDPRSAGQRNPDRPVGAAVVGNHDLGRQTMAADRLLCLDDAAFECFRLVETRHDDR